MLTLKKNTAAALAALAAEKFPGSTLSAEDIFAMLEYPPDSAMGDLALPCFRLSKSLHRSPVQIAETLATGFSCPEFEKVDAVNGYLNFRIRGSAFARRVVEDVLSQGKAYGSPRNGNGRTVILDYSSPNVAKPFHVGHLGTTVIGHSLKRLHEFAGYHCIGINYLGDWGTQFGKLIVAYKKWGDRATIEKGGVDELVALYVRINNGIKAEEDASVASLPEAERERAKKTSHLADEARAEFSKLEHGDPENTELWKWFVAVSLKEYEKTYQLLNITFDSYKGESFYTDKMPEQVEKLRSMGLLKLDDGASVVDLSEYDMPVCLILKRDGSTLYPTRDIAAAVYRKRTYNFDKCIYVTSSQQSLHFAQWFKVVELMGYDWYNELVHVPYGTVSIDGVKLSTRHGNVVLLRDVFEAAIEKVTKVIDEKNPGLENKKETAEAVGVGAIVFYYLMNNRIKDISFRMDDALSFDGNTGPYVQYTYARTCSLLEKSAEISGDRIKITSPYEAELAKVLSQFSETVLRAVAEYEPSVITRYILAVSTAFNRFYHECPILSAEDDVVRNTRTALTKATNTVLHSALPLICLKTPEKI